MLLGLSAHYIFLGGEAVTFAVRQSYFEAGAGFE